MGWEAPIPAPVLQLLERVCEASRPQAGYYGVKPPAGRVSGSRNSVAGTGGLADAGMDFSWEKSGQRATRFPVGPGWSRIFPGKIPVPL